MTPADCNDIEILRQALKASLDFVDEIASYECYVMCGCQSKAQEVQDAVGKLFEPNPARQSPSPNS